MHVNIAEQTVNFLIFIAVGAALALLFELLSVLVKRKNIIILYLFDLLFCIIAFVSSCVAAVLCGGVFEGYMVLGAASGWLLVYLIFEDFFNKKRRF